MIGNAAPDTPTSASYKSKISNMPNPISVTLQDIQPDIFFKQINISCDSIEQFTTFYNSLCFCDLNYNIYITPHKNITNVDPQCALLILPGTITKHKLHPIYQ